MKIVEPENRSSLDSETKMTFGKYKNYSLREMVIRDKSYCEWLLRQDWFSAFTYRDELVKLVVHMNTI